MDGREANDLSKHFFNSKFPISFLSLLFSLVFIFPLLLLLDNLVILVQVLYFNHTVTIIKGVYFDLPIRQYTPTFSHRTGGVSPFLRTLLTDLFTSTKSVISLE